MSAFPELGFDVQHWKQKLSFYAKDNIEYKFPKFWPRTIIAHWLKAMGSIYVFFVEPYWNCWVWLVNDHFASAELLTD